MSLVTHKIARLSPEKQAVLEKLLKKQGLDISRLPIAVQPRDTNNFPLSFSQQRMWLLHQIDPENTAYNCSAAWRVTGKLSLPTLQKAATELVQRHEALRTTFTTRDGQPFQVIMSHADIVLHSLDLRSCPVPEQLAQIQSIATSEAQRPFDLTRGPLLRMLLLRLGQEDYVLLITMHHIISDGWSLGIMAREMVTFYKAYAAGEPICLARPPIQYADYAVWQQERLQGDRLADQLSYWKEQLTGAPALLTLPMSKPRPAVWSNQGAVRRFTLSNELSERLKALARQEGATLFMLLLSAFTVLLSRYTNQQDILLGTPIANRNRPEIANVVGCFINTLALRTKLTPEMSFRQLLTQVQRTTTDAYSHQDLPFEKLIEALHVERDTSYLPLIQVFFVLQNIKIEALDLPGLSLKPLETAKGVAQFDLTLEISEEPEKLAGHFEYSTALFDESVMEHMIGHWQTLLEGIVRQPDLPVEQLPLLTEKEYRLLTTAWNATQYPYPVEQCIHQLFEAQVEQTPNAVAAIFGKEQLTYHELNMRANHMAHRLRRLGIGPEVLVGLCMERSLEMLIGLLAILKAGGAYVPLDPAYPTERLAFILQDINAPVLVTQKSLQERISSIGILNTYHIMYLDEVDEQFAQDSMKTVESGVTAANLAYVIYTSGSTGKPKGVQLAHRAVVNFLTSMCTQPGLTQQDTLLAVTSISFDIAGLELFLPLIVGAQLVIASKSVARDGEQLRQLLDEKRITIMQATPTTWHMLLGVGWCSHEGFRALCGGEALPPRLACQLIERGATLWNMYGPTETTIWSALSRVAEVKGTIPLGRPIANTQIYLLDSQLELVPIGVAGELYIGGAGLSRGYLHRPDLTAERFLPDPFSVTPGGRLYRTGDLARFLSNGTLEFLGRIDHQVKIRGFRVELGEIETALLQYPGVQAAAVWLQEYGADDKRLVAYLVPKNPDNLAVSELRTFLNDRLPDYMLPSAYVLLERLPLTANGKLDRRALPPPQERTVRDDKPLIAPRTPLEQMLAGIWQQILNVPRVGIHDNFFDSGGNSLLAIQLMTRIQEHLGTPAPLSIIFQAPTLQEMADLLAVRQQTSDWSPLVAIHPQGSRRPFFCVHPAPGNVFCYTDLARMLGKDQPFYGLQARGIDGRLPPLTTIEEMASLYIQAIRTIQPKGPYLLGGHSLGGSIAFEMSRQLQNQGNRVALLAILDTLAPLSKVASKPAPSGERAELAWLLADGTTLLAQFSGKDIALSQETLQQMEPAAQMEHVRRHLQLHGFLSQDEEDMGPIQGYLQVQKASAQAFAAYTPQACPAASTSGEIIALFRSQEWQQEHSGNDLDSQFSDRSLGWSRLIPQGLHIYDIPGNHITMLTPPYVHVLAEWLRHCLEQIQGETYQ